MPRKSNLPRGGRRTSAPVRVVVAVPEYTSRAVPGRQGVSSKTARGVWWLYRRRWGDQWSEDREPTLDGCRSFWTKIADMVQTGVRLYILAPSAADLLTASGWWALVPKGGYEVIQWEPGTDDDEGDERQRKVKWAAMPVMRGHTDIIRARVNGGTIVCISRTNYCDPSWADLAASVGYELPPIDREPGAFGLTEPTGFDQCRILSRWYTGQISSWVREQTGPWGMTAGQLSLSIWRARDGKSAVRRHRRQDATDIEVAACWGGRASAWFFGDVGTPDPASCPGSYPPSAAPYPPLGGRVYRYDVRSMYPYLLGHETYPVQLCGVSYDVGVSELAAMLQYWCVIATVRIDTQEAEYPVRIRGNVRYPVGRFDTTLAGPELAQALSRDHVRRVYALARYRMGTPFVMWSQCVLDSRRMARQRKDAASELLWKCIANAFGGKFAQRSTNWIMEPTVIPPQDWGEWYEASHTGGMGKKCRAIAGVQYRGEPGTPGHRLPLSVYCYLTSYGRTLMRSIRERLPKGSVLSQDTDGLFSLAKPHTIRRLVPGHYGQTPGKLRLVSEHSYARWYSPKHYCVDGRWTLAGYCTGWTWADQSSIRERVTVNPARGGARGCPTKILDVVRTVCLPSIDPETPIGLDGWAKTYEIDPRLPPPPLPPCVSRTLFDGHDPPPETH